FLLGKGPEVLVFDTNEWIADLGFYRQDSPYTGHTGYVHTIAISSGDKPVIASGSEDKRVHVWIPESNTQIVLYTTHKDAVLAVAWSPDAKRIASAGREKTILVWPVDGPLDEFSFSYGEHSSAIYSLAWSPD